MNEATRMSDSRVVAVMNGITSLEEGEEATIRNEITGQVIRK